MKPPRLSKAQWELLRKLPDRASRFRIGTNGNQDRTARLLATRGLVSRENGFWWCRTSAGRAFIEVEDRRAQEQMDNDIAEND